MLTETTKGAFEKAFAAIGVRAVGRLRIGNNDVFIADGFVSPAWINRGFLVRFGINPWSYPTGCYVTAWLSGAGHCGVASFNPGVDTADKMRARMTIVANLAEDGLRKLKLYGKR